MTTRTGAAPLRVLVVEDEPDHRRALILTLRLGGYEPWESESGEAALGTLGAGPDPGTSPTPDAIVLDIRLPGIDGVEVLERLRAAVSTRGLPVVLVSAHARIPTAVHEDPWSRFLRKPFHPDQLLEQLGELLTHRAGQES